MNAPVGYLVQGQEGPEQHLSACRTGVQAAKFSQQQGTGRHAADLLGGCQCSAQCLLLACALQFVRHKQKGGAAGGPALGLAAWRRAPPHTGGAVRRRGGAAISQHGTGVRVPGRQQAGTCQCGRPQFGVKIGRQKTEDLTARASWFQVWSAAINAPSTNCRRSLPPKLRSKDGQGPTVCAAILQLPGLRQGCGQQVAPKVRCKYGEQGGAIGLCFRLGSNHHCKVQILRLQQRYQAAHYLDLVRAIGKLL